MAVVTAALVVGTGNAFFQPALSGSGLPVKLAPRERFGGVNALISVARTAAGLRHPQTERPAGAAAEHQVSAGPETEQDEDQQAAEPGRSNRRI